MTPEKREELREAAFDEPDVIEVAGLKLRTLSVRDIKRAELLGLRLLLEPPDKIMEIPADRVLREAVTIAWMKSEPVELVAATFRAGKEAVEEAVDLFEDRLALDQVKSIVREVSRIVKIANAAIVELLDSEQADSGNS